MALWVQKDHSYISWIPRNNSSKFDNFLNLGHSRDGTATVGHWTFRRPRDLTRTMPTIKMPTQTCLHWWFVDTKNKMIFTISCNFAFQVLTTFHNYWHFFTTIDNYWQLLTTIDNFWQLLIAIDNFWSQWS